tara:strand:+ start:121 stop:384 length:264 start_codon:yes stop_codon:yes gene_type:complete
MGEEMEISDELSLRSNYEEAVYALSSDRRFLAIVEYWEFIYRSKLEAFEYSNSREALMDTGHKVCLREMLEDISLNTNETITVDTKW